MINGLGQEGDRERWVLAAIEGYLPSNSWASFLRYLSNSAHYGKIHR
jgi:hypothetical protein